MEINDAFKSDIDDIKNDICIIKNSVNTLSLAFNKHIQDHLIASSITQTENLNIAVLDNNQVKTDVDAIKNLQISTDLNDISSSDQLSETETIKYNLIDYSFIQSNDNNKSLLEILYQQDKNMYSCYHSNFIKFCHCAVNLVEEVIKIFLEKKFINIIEENNDKLLQACDLLEEKYQEKSFTFPDIYISKNQYNKINKTNVDDYYYNSSRDEYLSLANLKEAKIIFTLELCFLTLYGEDFYNIPDFKPKRPAVQSQTSSKALKRPSDKLASSLEPLNKEFYYFINNARDFRNKIAHNEYNKQEQKKQIDELLLKKPHLKNTENNYDGIVKAVTWLIRQIYVAIKQG